ncbi:MAG: hypothetical protein NTV34_10295 [Proteobacteria bacterium]|nr:hypothetical protein [Pseudomonadota bacterium]
MKIYTTAIALMLVSCQMATKRDQSNNDVKNIQISKALSVSLKSRIAGGIFVFDTNSRKVTQIKEVDNGGFIKYSFRKTPNSPVYEFAYAPDAGPEKAEVRSFSFNSSTLSATASTKVNLPNNGQLNGPSLCSQQNILAFVTLSSDRLKVSALDFGSATILSVVDEPKRVAADLNCEGLKSGIVYSSFTCPTSDINACFQTDRSMTEVHYANKSAKTSQITFPLLDQRIIHSPNRPKAWHLGDVDSRAIETDRGNFLVFQRIYTTPELFAGGRLANSSFAVEGFHASYFKEVGSFDSPKRKEYRLNYNSWILSHYKKEQRSSVVVESIMNAPDIAVSGVDSSKIEIVIGASIKTWDGSYQPGFKFDGLLRGRFVYSPPSTTEEIEVESVKPILEMKEFACAIWRESDIVDNDGNINVYTHVYPRFVESDDLMFFSSSKLPIIKKDMIENIGGIRRVSINGQRILLSDWQSQFCGAN